MKMTRNTESTVLLRMKSPCKEEITGIDEVWVKTGSFRQGRMASVGALLKKRTTFQFLPVYNPINFLFLWFKIKLIFKMVLVHIGMVHPR